jgi:TRAP transporter 4TM/12TM fusion protein
MSQDEGLRSKFRVLLTVTSLVMMVYHFWYIVELPYEPSVSAIIHLGFAFSVLFLSYLSKKLNPLHALCLLIGIGVTWYFVSQYDAILYNPSYPPMAAMICGVVATAMTFYLTYKTFGLIFPIVAAVGILYVLFGSNLPGGLRAPSTDFSRLVVLLSADVTSPWGTYGNMLMLSSNYLFLFVVFGSIMESFGGLYFIMAIGQKVAAHMRSGAAALCIVSSELLGSVTGSTVANISIFGPFTIPLMKKSRYTAEQAAAIETAASNGGQILPPVMGSTVFVMSGFTGIPYLTIAKACTFSALIYFVLLLMYAELNARKRNIQKVESAPVDKRSILFSAPIFIAPLCLLVYLLASGLSLMKTIFFCILLTVAFGLLSCLFQSDRRDWKGILNKINEGVVSGCQIAVVLAVIGVVVACVEVTGLGMRLSDFLLAVSLNSLPLLLVLTAIAAIVLGMGLPTPAVYIICATILSPAIMKMGVPVMQAHLFPLYYALFSHITPPVGIGLMVACKIAEADYLKAAVEALKAAFATFLLPFLFIYAPGVLLQQSFADNTLQLAATLAAFMSLSILVNRFFINHLSIVDTFLCTASLLLLASYLIISHMPLLFVVGIACLIMSMFFNARNASRVQKEPA